MPATEQPLGAIPSSRSVSRLRRQGKHDPDTNNDSDSRASSAGDDSADTADMKKSSMDAAIDKVRERARKSVDERRGSDDSASQTRFSAMITRKLKRKDKDKDKDSLGARNSTLVVDSGESGDLALSDARSDGSLLDEDGHSSLLTDDGDDNDGYVLNIYSILDFVVYPYLHSSSHPSTNHPHLQTNAIYRSACFSSASSGWAKSKRITNSLRAECELSHLRLGLLAFTL
jgi:hypothetical protein